MTGGANTDGTGVALHLRSIAKSYGPDVALHPLDLAIEDGEFLTILGPSGCGKSTLLRIVMGITEPTGGQLWLRGRDITRVAPERRDIAMVFQSYALFPHMSVARNISFGLRMKGVPAAEQRRRTAHVVEICGLGALVERSPRDLSGGQQQRVALARALVLEPSLLLLDEPLSNLDAKLRETLRDELLALHRKTGSTSLYVTHDQAEAMSMSDRVVVMDRGRILEIGTPRELYLAPRTRFTAQFLGLTNIIPVDAHGVSACLPWGQVVPLARPHQGAGEVSLRPESLDMRPDDAGNATVRDLSFHGADILYTLDCAGQALRTRRGSGEPLLAPGSRVAIEARGGAHVLEAEGVA